MELSKWEIRMADYDNTMITKKTKVQKKLPPDLPLAL